jgi:hypothetical protein
MQPPQRILAKEELEPWERNGTVMQACKKCGYHGEVPWNPEACESGQWRCPQCARLWPFLDLDHLWIAPCREIEYRGSIDLAPPVSGGGFSTPTTKIRVWRQCDDDPSLCFLHSDPESERGDDFHWGLRRYRAERISALNLAYAILYDFYGWLSCADFEITEEPYSKKRWAATACSRLPGSNDRSPAYGKVLGTWQCEYASGLASNRTGILCAAGGLTFAGCVFRGASPRLQKGAVGLAESPFGDGGNCSNRRPVSGFMRLCLSPE